MEIEKTSWYMILTPDSRSSLVESTAGRRKVLMSLPRVKWLERDDQKPEPKKVTARDLMPPPREPPPRVVWQRPPARPHRSKRDAEGYTPRERQVLERMDRGMATRQIADDLRVTTGTVRKMKRFIMKTRGER